jgi:DNA-binding CsgD family transcriptional regulator
MAQVDWGAATESWAWLAFGSTEAEQVRALAEHTRACLHQADFLRMVAYEQETDLRRELCGIKAETLVISHSSFARLAPDETARELVHLIPLARVVGVTNRKERVEAIATFLAEADGQPLATSPPGSIPMTEREVEVLTLLAHGLTNRDIAERMTLSPRTVDSHVVNIYRKLGMSRRAEAVAYAIRNGFV